MQIVLAKIEMKPTVVDTSGIDLGKTPKIRITKKPVAVMWINHGNTDDLEKARDFAKKESYTVFVYFNEPNPLERARQEINK